MTAVTPVPGLDAFFAAPAADIATIAPQTAIVSANGTRRAAALAGIPPHTDTYVAWSHQRMMAYMDLLFTHGIRHVFAAMIIAVNMVEFAAYRERFLYWVAEGLARPEVLEEYIRRGWRVRLVGAEQVPELQETAKQLIAATPANYRHTLWWTLTPTNDAPWDAVLSTVARTGARTRTEAIRAMYGEDLPPAELFISSGKPMALYDLLPPLLAGRKLQCYWVQRPGYALDERMLRTILYDWAYTRRAEPSVPAGAADVIARRDIWETDAVLGVGRRLGPFWYHTSLLPPGDER